MKSIYNAFKTPVTQSLKSEVSEVIKKGIKATNALDQVTKHFEIEDKVNIDLNKFEINKQLASYNSSAIQNSNFEHSLKLTNLNQLGIKKYGLTNLSHMQFSTKRSDMEKYADPTNDLVFKKLFGNEVNKELLIDFINKVLPDKHVKDIEYLPTNLEPDIRIKKQSVLDILCTDQNGSKYIIEMQNAKEKGFEKRAIYYASKTYATQMDKGGKYADLKEVIFVAITNFIMFPEKDNYISTHNIRDIETNENDLKDFSFAFLELPKFDKRNEVEGIGEWCDLLKNAVNRNTCNATNPIIVRAYEALEMSNWSDQDLLDYQAYEKMSLDNQAREDQVRDEGKIEGKIEGKDEKAIEIAKNLINMAKLSDEEIAKTTGLTKEEVGKLR